MKLSSGFLLGMGFILAISGAHAGNADVDIKVLPKKIANKVVARQSDEVNKASEWGYNVTIENKSFRPITGLEVKYIVFYKHEELGVKGPPQKKHFSGTFTVDSIAPNNKSSSDTTTVELKSSSLLGTDGSYMYFADGAKSKVQDALTGIWIRVFKDGKLYAEMAKPSELSNKENWDSNK